MTKQQKQVLINTLALITKNYSKQWLQLLIGVFVIFFFSACYILLTLNKYWQFEYFFKDNVLFDRALWLVANGKAPIVNHELLGQVNILGDHFHPTIFIGSIFYHLFPRQETILIFMSVAYGLSGYVGMLIGFKLLKSRLIVFALLISYFLYLGTLNAFLYGFHELNLMPLFFLLVMYSLISDKKRLYWASLFFLLLTKESLALLAITIGIFTWFCYPKKRSTAIATIIISILYFLIVTRVVIPFFSHKYLYANFLPPKTLTDLLFKLIYPYEKIETFFVSMATFGFLPLFSLITYPLWAQDLLIRDIFSQGFNMQYELFFHYNLGLVPILLFSSIWSIKYVETKKWGSRLIILFAILIIVSNIFFLKSYSIKNPFMLVFNKDFFQVTNNNKFLWELVEKTPRGSKIMTQNHLGFMFAHDDVYLLTKDYGFLSSITPKYIVVDLRDGQNPNNFFPLTQEETSNLVKGLVDKNIYKVYWQKNSLIILEKNLAFNLWPR